MLLGLGSELEFRFTMRGAFGFESTGDCRTIPTGSKEIRNVYTIQIYTERTTTV